LPPDISLFGVISLELEMEDALGVPVDVATEDELHPSLKARILAEARPI
jgi:predicted nucleotidyltransferase